MWPDLLKAWKMFILKGLKEALRDWCGKMSKKWMKCMIMITDGHYGKNIGRCCQKWHFEKVPLARKSMCIIFFGPEVGGISCEKALSMCRKFQLDIIVNGWARGIGGVGLKKKKKKKEKIPNKKKKKKKKKIQKVICRESDDFVEDSKKSTKLLRLDKLLVSYLDRGSAF